MRFTEFQFPAAIAAGVQAAGFEEPTPIQEQSIPPIRKGQDLMGLAQTGTGKTAAFVLPILERLMPGARGHIRALILAPTRELADQIQADIARLGRDTGLHSAAVYGGVAMGPQVQALKHGIDIAVACPGRLLDHLSRRTVRLEEVEVLVLDEADRMFDMGFLPDVRRILSHVPAQRQTLLFSATMPDDVRHLAHDILRNPVMVQVGNIAPVATVAHALYPVPSHLKTKLLMELLKHTDTDSVLVFTRTKHRARRVGEQLLKAGYKAASLQGNLSQNRRKAAMDGFRSGEHQILVATDIAARGIDVSSISHVVNYDIPDTADAYLHRIGRTGRAAKTGDAFTLISSEDEDMVRSIERMLGSVIERRRVEGFDYQAASAGQAEFARPPRQQRQSRPPRSADSRQPGSSAQPPRRQPQQRPGQRPRPPSGPHSGPRPGAPAGGYAGPDRPRGPQGHQGPPRSSSDPAMPTSTAGRLSYVGPYEPPLTAPGGQRLHPARPARPFRPARPPGQFSRRSTYGWTPRHGGGGGGGGGPDVSGNR